jgi:hypothetical protein
MGMKIHLTFETEVEAEFDKTASPFIRETV